MTREPFIAYSELTNEIYIVVGKEKYRVTEQAIKAVKAIKALDQEQALDKIRAEIEDTLYVDSLIFGELIDFKNGKISADDVIEEFNRVTRLEVLKIFDKYKAESEG